MVKLGFRRTKGATHTNILIVQTKTLNLGDDSINKIDFTATLDIANVFRDIIVARTLRPIFTNGSGSFIGIRYIEFGGSFDEGRNLNTLLAEACTLGGPQGRVCLKKLIKNTKVEDMTAVAILIEGNVMGKVVGSLDTSNDETVGKVWLGSVTFCVIQGRDVNIFNAIVLQSEVDESLGEDVRVALCWQRTSENLIQNYQGTLPRLLQFASPFGQWRRLHRYQW